MANYKPSKKLLKELEDLVCNYPPEEMNRIIRNCFMDYCYYQCAEGLGLSPENKKEFLFLSALFRFFDVAAQEKVSKQASTNAVST